MERTVGQRLLAEFVGTFTLVFVAGGAIIVGTTGVSGAGSVTSVALAYGLAVAVMFSALGHVSGGHFNPAVTVAAWVTQKITLQDSIGYIAAQLAGGAAGATLLRVGIPQIFREAPTASLGVPALHGSFDAGEGVLIEAVLTFFLVWVFFAVAVDGNGGFGRAAGFAIGLTVTMGVLMGHPITGAAMNPARWFGPALVGGYWSNWWVWILGPVAGGIVAAVVYDSFIMRPRELVPAPPEDDALPGIEPTGDDG